MDNIDKDLVKKLNRAIKAVQELVAIEKIKTITEIKNLIDNDWIDLREEVLNPIGYDMDEEKDLVYKSKPLRRKISVTIEMECSSVLEFENELGSDNDFDLIDSIIYQLDNGDKDDSSCHHNKLNITVNEEAFDLPYKL